MKPDMDNRSRWVYAHYDIKTVQALQRFGSFRLNGVLYELLQVDRTFQLEFEMFQLQNGQNVNMQARG